MASTSSPSYSSSPCPRWHVFLSFRGKDTRRNFTGHLYSALRQAGIRTFIDNEIPRGEEISAELRKTIQESTMSIIVFSRNYAFSSWCLEELVEILECKRTKGHGVIPVFYDVEPTAVRFQKCSFAKAHKKRHRDKVERWKVALKEAADLSGHHLQNDANGHEANFIEKIVKDVLPKLPRKDWKFVTHPVGIHSRVKDIYSMLSIGTSDVRFIGIYGMAGIGKTTIVKDFYDRTFHHFERSCFLENVGEALKVANGLRFLLKQLIIKLLKVENFEFDDVRRGIFVLQQALRSKRVLIVIDDLDQLTELIPSPEDSPWFGSGSRIIITTRDACLLDNIGILNLRYEVKKLDNDESLELFNQHAFRNSDPPTDFMELSRRFVRYIGGLPIGLEKIGSFLFERNMLVWKLSFEIFQIIPIDQIQVNLRISYDALVDKKLQNTFLDIACFFIGMDKDDAINVLNDHDFSVEKGIDTLMGRFLLTTDGRNKLGMNALIRDMGRNIVRQESIKEPGRRSRLWFHKDAYDVLNYLKGTETIEGIKLEMPMPMPEREHLSTKTFENMPNLRILHISKVNFSGSFENLFKELRWLCWHYSPLEFLPTEFQPPKLVFLDMQHSKVNILWRDTKHLQNLKILNVSHSQFLTTTPDLGGVKKLEKLLLRNCSSLDQIHPSIGLLSKLSHLDLNGCFKLNQLPEQLGSLEGLKKLDASGTNIEQMPDSIGHLNKLVELNLEGCRNLRTLPSTICHLTSLEMLSLDSCSKLENLPENLGNVQSLSRLDASRTAIGQLPDSVVHLNKLVELNLEGCRNLRTLPSSICHLTSLEVLSLESCSNLNSLPEKLGNMNCLRCLTASTSVMQQFPPHLYSLELTNCNTLQSLYELPPHLYDLRLINCTSLQSLLEFPCNLNELDLTNCSSLQSLPDLPPKIKTVRARGCTSLEKLPNLSMLKQLTSLYLENCSNLRLLPDLPPNLCRLYLTNCRNLRSVPRLHPNLDYICLRDCSNLESPPEFPRSTFFTI